MRIGKPQSKRVPVRLRHSIQKAGAAKVRKGRKEEKKNPQWRSRLKKDPGIPNLFPYKDKMLAEIEVGRQNKVDEAKRRREVAKAQRLGINVEVVDASAGAANEDADIDEDILEDIEEDEDVEMEAQHDSNPMAALLASAQARAKTYKKPEAGAQDGDDDDDDDDGEEETGEAWSGITEAKTSRPAAPAAPAPRKKLPKAAIADPIKTVTALMTRMQSTPDGIERLTSYYALPPLAATTNTDFTSRFLVEVARKRGRLGRGGVPNLHSAALTVLADLNEDRLVLPSDEKKNKDVAKKSDVKIVKAMAEPFRLEGLWGGDGKLKSTVGEGMVVDA